MADENVRIPPDGIDPRLLSLPGNAATSSDPVDGNPFAVADPRHAIWKRDSRQAEEAVARARSTWLAFVAPDIESGGSLNAPERWNEHSRNLIELYHVQFDAWAWRGIGVIATDTDVTAYRRWLVAYSDAFLREVALLQAALGAPPDFITRHLSEFRQVLMVRVRHWEAEAVARVVLYDKAKQQQEHTARQGPQPEQREPQTQQQDPGLLERAMWLNAELVRRELSLLQIEAKGGPTPKTTQRILDGKPVGHGTIRKLAHALGLPSIHKIPG